RVGARGRGGAERGCLGHGSWRVVREKAPHLLLRHDRLYHGRKGESEDQRPEDLPGHAARERKRVQDLLTHVDADEHQDCGAPSGGAAARFRRRRRLPRPTTSAAPTTAAIAITIVSVLEPPPPFAAGGGSVGTASPAPKPPPHRPRVTT